MTIHPKTPHRKANTRHLKTSFHKTEHFGHVNAVEIPIRISRTTFYSLFYPPKLQFSITHIQHITALEPSSWLTDKMVIDKIHGDQRPSTMLNIADIEIKYEHCLKERI